jgi:hypothetical protein
MIDARIEPSSTQARQGESEENGESSNADCGLRNAD